MEKAWFGHCSHNAWRWHVLGALQYCRYDHSSQMHSIISPPLCGLYFDCDVCTLIVKRNLPLLQGHCIKISNIGAQISFNTPLIRIFEKYKIFLASKRRGENAVKSRKVIFQKLRRNCSPRERWASSTEAAYSEHSIGYSFNFNGGLCKHCTGYCLLRTPSPRGKQFSVIFENWPLAISSHLSPLWLK